MSEDKKLRVVTGSGEETTGGEPGPLDQSDQSPAQLYRKKLEGMRLRGLRPDIACDTCRDSKWVTASDGVVRCPDCAEEDYPQRVERLCAAAGIPRRYRRKGLREYEDEYNQAYLAQEAFDAAEKWAGEWTAEGSPEQWLYVLGYGRPATALACAVAHDLIAAGLFASEEIGAGMGVRYESAVDLLDELRTSYSEKTRPLEARERAERPRLLLLDGLTGSPEDKALTRFLSLLGHRDAEMLPTIVVSRYTPSELAVGFGDEVSEILNSSCRVVDLKGGES